MAPVIIGSLLPDAPMFVFYVWQRLQAVPEQTIWRELYYDPGWQAFFDVFNSLPLITLAWIAARLFGWRWLMWLAAGMALHVPCDLPLHFDDAHRHFFPFSDWRIGGLADWRIGGLADWRIGGLADWRFGGLAVWRFGGLAVWRFASPVSYWNPAHYGRIVSIVEVALSGFAVAWLWHRHPGVGTRLAVSALAAAYAAHWIFVFTVWA